MKSLFKRNRKRSWREKRSELSSYGSYEVRLPCEKPTTLAYTTSLHSVHLDQDINYVIMYSMLLCFPEDPTGQFPYARLVCWFLPPMAKRETFLVVLSWACRLSGLLSVCMYFRLWVYIPFPEHLQINVATRTSENQRSRGSTQVMYST